MSLPARFGCHGEYREALENGGMAGRRRVYIGKVFRVGISLNIHNAWALDPADGPAVPEYAKGAFSLLLFSENHGISNYLNRKDSSCSPCESSVDWDDGPTACVSCGRVVVLASTCTGCAKRDVTYCVECTVGPPPAKRLQMTKDFDHMGGNLSTGIPRLGPQFYGADFIRVFLCDAKLYVLGKDKDLQELKYLAFWRIHTELCEYAIYASLAESKQPILQLIRYVLMLRLRTTTFRICCQDTAR